MAERIIYDPDEIRESLKNFCNGFDRQVFDENKSFREQWKKRTAYILFLISFAYLIVTAGQPVVPNPAHAMQGPAQLVGEVLYRQSYDSYSRTYVIQPGDTLSSIARQLGVDFNDIASINGLIDPNHIIAGDTLLIPNSNQ